MKTINELATILSTDAATIRKIIKGLQPNRVSVVDSDPLNTDEISAISYVKNAVSTGVF